MALRPSYAAPGTRQISNPFVIPDKRGAAERRSGTQRKERAKHTIYGARAAHSLRWVPALVRYAHFGRDDEIGIGTGTAPRRLAGDTLSLQCHAPRRTGRHWPAAARGGMTVDAGG